MSDETTAIQKAPPATKEELAALCKTYTIEAVERLVEIMRSNEVRPSDSIRAIRELLDRGYGKAQQNLQTQIEEKIHFDFSGLNTEQKLQLARKLRSMKVVEANTNDRELPRN